MHEKRILTVRVDPTEQQKGRFFGYCVSTVVRLSGAHPETVRREIRLGRLQMDDLLSVADWIRRRRDGTSFLAIGRRTRCSGRYVAAAAARGEFDPADQKSVDRWVYERQHRATHGTPALALTRYSCFRSRVSLRKHGLLAGSQAKVVVHQLIEELRELGFAGVRRRGVNHIAISPDILYVADVRKLIDRMYTAGLRAKDLDAQARRWLILFSGALPDKIRALGKRFTAAGSPTAPAASA